MRFPPGFNFPLSFTFYPWCGDGTRKTSLLSIFSEERKYFTVKSDQQKKIYWVTLTGMFLWPGWVGSGRNKDIWKLRLCLLGLNGLQSTLNHLIAGEFPPCYLDHAALVGRRHVMCSFALQNLGLNVTSIRQPFMECLS